MDTHIGRSQLESPELEEGINFLIFAAGMAILAVKLFLFLLIFTLALGLVMALFSGDPIQMIAVILVGGWYIAKWVRKCAGGGEAR